MGYTEGDDTKGTCDVCGEGFDTNDPRPSMFEIGEFCNKSGKARACEGCGAVSGGPSEMFPLYHHGRCSPADRNIVEIEVEIEHFICHAQCGIDAELELA